MVLLFSPSLLRCSLQPERIRVQVHLSSLAPPQSGLVQRKGFLRRIPGCLSGRSIPCAAGAPWLGSLILDDVPSDL